MVFSHKCSFYVNSIDHVIRMQPSRPHSSFVGKKLQFYVDAMLSFSVMTYSWGAMIKMSFPTPRFYLEIL